MQFEPKPREGARDVKSGSFRSPRFVMLQPVLFVIVGLANTAIDLCLYILLTRILSFSPVLAHVIGYGTGMLNGYVMNGLLTFRGSGVRLLAIASQIRFALSAILSLAASTIGMAIAVRLLPDLEAKVLCTVFTTVLNYGLSRYFVYHQRTPAR